MADAYDFWADRIAVEETAAIGRFWEKFVGIADNLDLYWTTGDTDIDPTEATLDAIGPLTEMGIYWEYGPGERGHHLTLSPELNHEARPLARALLRQAPDIPRWTFSDARPADELSDHTPDLIAGRAGLDFSLTGALASRGEHLRIDFTGEGKADEDTLGGLAGLTFSVLFGEEIERDWLGETHGERIGLAAGLFRKSADPVTWLPSFVESTQGILEDLRSTRPEAQRADLNLREAAATLFEVKPRGDAEEIGADLFNYNSSYEALAKAMLAGARVSSPRFSRFAESFCGIAIARTESHPFDDVEDRYSISESLHDALAKQRIGGNTGEGHGLGHVYIDFATTDIPMAIATAETVLGQADLTGPAWFRFHEAGLEELTLPLTSATTRH